MNNLITPPKSWENLDTHYRQVLTSDWYKVISRLQCKFVSYTYEFYKQKGYEFQMLPITTSGVSSPIGAGSDSIPVKISIDNIDTYLADSMQFFLEFSCRLNHNGNYYIAPSFRGELADKRHLCQFYHSEAEIIGNLEDIINLVEKYLRFLIENFFQNDIQSILSITGDSKHIVRLLMLLKSRIPRCTYVEASIILGNKDDCFKNENRVISITSKGEQELIEHFGGAVWLTYPEHLAVPFYQAYKQNDDKFANCADLLMGVGETVGAGERHLTAGEVIKSLKAHSVDIDEYDWYVDMKSLVPMKTSGFGMGVERFMLWLIQHDDIRDMQLLPRFNGQKSRF